MPESDFESPVLIVEERLHLAEAYLRALRAVGDLIEQADEPVPLFEHPLAFPEWVGRMSDAAMRQLRLVRAALPATCGGHDAPSELMSTPTLTRSARC
jgi:hypothetical protein